jgi:tight adherence protein B
MTMIAVFVFLGIFALVALPAIAVTSGPSKTERQMMATLDSALANESPEVRLQTVNLRKDQRFSTIPWLNQKLHQMELVPHVQRLLDQADTSWTASKLLAACLVGFAVPMYGMYLHWGLVPLEFPVALAFGIAPILWILYKRKRRFFRFQEGLPEALDMMVSALRAGHSLNAAMGLVGRECPAPVGSEFRTCFDEQNYGLEMKAALDNLIDRVPLQDLRMVATAIMIQKESGGNLAEVLDKTAHCIREQFRLKRDVRVHTAQGRMTGIILTLLPVVLGIMIYFVNPDMMSVLWTRPLGIKLMWASGIMTVIGGLIIRRIVNMEV